MSDSEAERVSLRFTYYILMNSKSELQINIACAKYFFKPLHGNYCMPRREKAMTLEANSVFTAMRYLIPRNNFWLKRISVLFAFIFLDYLVTLILCTKPLEEGNLLARSFMEAYGIPLGLTLFDLIANLPIYIMLSLNSHLINLPPKLLRVGEILVDIVFAWFIAGLHFNGAASWVWFAPDLMRQALGASLYFVIIFALHRRTK